MKILVVCQHFYPEEFRINDICYELVKKGHDVTVLTGLPNYPKGKVLKEYRWFKNRNQIINGVKIKRCSLVGRGKSKLQMAINYAWFAFFGSLKSLFMKKDFDCVYVYQLSPITMAWPAIVVSSIKKIPLVIHCLDQWPISLTMGGTTKYTFAYKIATKISKWTYNKANLITISSKSFKKYFENVLHLKNKKFIYLPSYAEDDYKNIKYENNKTFDLLFAGNIGPAQSVETIIETANILKNNNNIIFHIVGDGLSREKCENLAKKYQLNNVKFYGFHPANKMPEFYKKADAFLITMEDNEVVNNTLPAKIQSYMVAGRPIFGAINGEVKLVVEDAKCGLCCKSLDYESLAKLIINNYEKKEELDLWGKNGQLYYEENFKKEVCMDNLEKVLKDIKKGIK